MLTGYVWSADSASEPAAFEACDPRVDGDEATAVCRSAIDNWIVSRRKAGASWKVESARPER